MAPFAQIVTYLSTIIAFSLRSSEGITLFARNAKECSQDMVINQHIPMRDFHKCSLNDTCKYVVWNEEKKMAQMHSKFSSSTDSKASISAWTKMFLPEEPITINQNGTQLTVWRDCNQVVLFGQVQPAVRYIMPRGSRSIMKVFCDLKTSQKGWIVIQRRVDNTTNFERNWTDYKRGFGTLNRNLWIGLDAMHTLAPPQYKTMLRVDIRHVHDPKKIYFAEYMKFAVGPELTNYRLTAEDYNPASTAGDDLNFMHWSGGYRINAGFSTYDNDNSPAQNDCAGRLRGAWWHGRACCMACLNGVYPAVVEEMDCNVTTEEWFRTSDKFFHHMRWYGVRECLGGIFFAEMKITSL